MPDFAKGSIGVAAAGLAALSALLLALGFGLAVHGHDMRGSWFPHLALFVAAVAVAGGVGRLKRLPPGRRLEYLVRGGSTPPTAYWASPRCGRYQILSGSLLGLVSLVVAIALPSSPYVGGLVFAAYVISEFYHLYWGRRHDAALRVRSGEH